MGTDLALGMLTAIGSYLGLGFLFALAFVTWGAPRLDPAARGMPASVRLLLIPGAAALWPLLLWKWAARRSPPEA
ncbi:MAG: hypothetical protein RLZ83_992 [Pseudomonadota bacterium]|jgi:hypothetical protein